jgi:hypothetical protein
MKRTYVWQDALQPAGMMLMGSEDQGMGPNLTTDWYPGTSKEVIGFIVINNAYCQPAVWDFIIIAAI